MVSWSMAVASKRQENRQKKSRFCKRYSEPLFVNRGVYFRNRKTADPHSRFAWALLSLSSTFVSDDGSHAHHRPEAKEAVRRLTTKKCGSPLRRSPCLGSSFSETGFRFFSFPIFQDVIQCHVNCCFQALGHDGHNLFFQNGLLLLLFLLVFLTV